MAEKRSFYEAVATLIGTIIGAGIFGIPYVVAKAGFLVGMVNFVVLGFMIMMINLYTGEIALRTKKTHQLVGFADIYLGKWGKWIMTFTSLFSIIGALIAYLIGEGEVLSAMFGGSAFMYSMIFFVIASTLIYFDLKVIKDSELWLNLVLLILILVICIVAIPSVNLQNLQSYDLSKIFLPYGVILFAFVGATAIPAMEVELKNNKKEMRKAILVGTLIPFIVYILFTISVVGVTGIKTTEVATVGLGEFFGKYMVFFGNLFPVLTMATSFFLLGLAMKWILHYDFKINKKLSWLITVSIPLILFLLGVNSFVGVIGFTGAIAGGIEGILLVLIAKMAKKKGEVEPAYSIPLPWIFAVILMLIFVLGLMFQFL